MVKKVMALFFFATTSYALEYVDLDKRLSRQKKENLLRELRMESRRGQASELLQEIETKKSIISSSTIPLKAQGVVGNALILPDGLVIHEGMHTSVGKVSVKNLRVGSFNLEPYGIVLGTGGPGAFSGQAPFAPPIPGTASPFPSLPAPPPPPPPPSSAPTMQAPPQAGAPAPTPPPANNPPPAPNPNPPGR